MIVIVKIKFIRLLIVDYLKWGLNFVIIFDSDN